MRRPGQQTNAEGEGEVGRRPGQEPSGGRGADSLRLKFVRRALGLTRHEMARDGKVLQDFEPRSGIVELRFLSVCSHGCVCNKLNRQKQKQGC